MKLSHLAFDSKQDAYEKQARELLDAHQSADPDAIRLFHQKHPRFLHDEIPWLPKNIDDSDIANTALDLEDARLAIARWYDFLNWPALKAFVEDATLEGSPVAMFEAAVEAVINGDLETLQSSLRTNPELVHARSTRITHFDPPVHRSTLLHYVAANGVEGYRQKTPKNAVEIAKALLNAGAEVDALADLYGAGCTTMTLLVSSCHPAQAGLQAELVDTLVDFGASVEPAGAGKWRSPLLTALVFGYHDAAEALVRRGAKVDDLAAAAGLGMVDRFAELLPASDASARQHALALAAAIGHAQIVKLLLDAGEDPNRYNPAGFHAHSTPLHQACLAGHIDAVRVLVERGARLDIKDTIYQGTPLGWAMHGGRREVEEYLRSKAQ